MYKAISGVEGVVQRIEDGAFVPLNGHSIDVQEYKAWRAEGGELLPADLPDPAIAIRQQIADIETASQVSGPMRTFMLGDFQAQFQQAAAQMTAAGTPTTAEQLLSHNILYQKALAVDNQIKALEAQLPS